MWNSKLSARPAVHECPACHQPQTEIQRKIGETPLGAVCFVCARPDCSLGLNLTKVDTWVAVDPLPAPPRSLRHGRLTRVLNVLGTPLTMWLHGATLAA